MALYVDFVGLNSLVEEPVDVNTNTVGNFSESRASGSTVFNAGRGDIQEDGTPTGVDGNTTPQATYGPFPDGEVRNTSLHTINGEDYLAALNLHRNGPYGYPIFRQLRAGQSPIIRRQRLTNIFSHYEYPGESVVFEDGRNTRNFSYINFTKLPPVGSILAIQFEGVGTKSVEFLNSGPMESDFSGDNKLSINLNDSSLTTLRSDHDRVKAIAQRIATAINALGLTSIYSVRVSSSEFLYSQAVILIVAKQFGPAGIDITASAIGQPDTRISNRKGTLEKVSRILTPKRKPVEHFNEVPVVSRHKPLRMIGSVTTLDEETNKDVLERVEVFTTLGNETTHFSNAKLNKFYGTEGYISEDYEDFVDLYLEGGVDGDESPIDEFRYLSYRQVVYPKEIYTYKNHTRNRINFVSRYWRDSRANRTETNVDNGFGFTVFSQSAWVLDAEQDFKNLTFQVTPGSYTVRHPNFLRGPASKALETSSSYSTLSQSTETITFPNSGDGNQEWSISLVGPDERAFDFSSIGLQNARPIGGYNGYPLYSTNTIFNADHASDSDLDPYGQRKQKITFNPWDTSAFTALRLANGGTTLGLEKEFQDLGYSTPLLLGNTSYAQLLKLDAQQFNPAYISHQSVAKSNWLNRTSASTISTWFLPRDGGVSYSSLGSMEQIQANYLSGTLFAEDVILPDGTKKISKLVNFDPVGPEGYGSISIRLGTAFTSSHDNSIVYRGADEPGAVHYKTTNVYKTSNPIYNAALALNPGLDAGTYADRNYASLIAAASANHLTVELNLSGSIPEFGVASALDNTEKTKRTRTFQRHHSHHTASVAANVRYRDPVGYAKVYINGKESSFADTRLYPSDAYNFLSSSQGHDYHQQQVLNGNTSILMNVGNVSNRASHHLKNESFLTVNPFNARGFSFSYWIKFNSDPTAFSLDTVTLPKSCVFLIQDSSNNTIIDHTIGGPHNAISVGFQAGAGAKRLFYAQKTSGNFEADTWYNVTFSMIKDGTNMTPTLQIYKKGENSPEGVTLANGGTGWQASDYGGAFTFAEWGSVNSSNKLFVLPAGASFSLVRAGHAVNPHGDFDNINLDNLAFWGGGLSPYQMNRIVSGSTATTAGAGVGLLTTNNGITLEDQGLTSISNTGGGSPDGYQIRYPGSDESVALSSSGVPVLRHARRLHEMNTKRGTQLRDDIYDPILDGFTRSVGRTSNFRRGDKILPFGDDASFRNAQFQANVIDHGTGTEVGQFDVGFWFKTTHENWQNRSLHNQWSAENGIASADQSSFGSSINIRPEGGKGFLISFWYKKQGGRLDGNAFDLRKADYEIMTSEMNDWGICITSDHSTSTATEKRKMAFWLNGKEGSARVGGSASTKSIFTSNMAIPEDGQFHFYTVQWNGRSGPESHVAFTIDHSPPDVRYEPSQYNTSLLEPVDLLTFEPPTDVDSSYARKVNILCTRQSADTVTATGNAPLPHQHSLACLSIIQDPPSPWVARNGAWDLYDGDFNFGFTQNLYNNGQRQDRFSDVNTLESSVHAGLQAVNNGQAYLFNPNGGDAFANTNEADWRLQSADAERCPLWKMVKDGNRATAFRAINEAGWTNTTYQADRNAAGWTISFMFKRGVSGVGTGTLTEWRDAGPMQICDLSDHSTGRNILELLYSYEHHGHDLYGFLEHTPVAPQTFAQTFIRFTNAAQTLLDGWTHHVVLTWDGSTDGAGRPVNCHLYIDGTRWPENHTYVNLASSRPANYNASNFPTPNRLSIGVRNNNSYQLPYTWYLGRVLMYPNYMGGDSLARTHHLSSRSPASLASEGQPIFEEISEIRNLGNYVGTPYTTTALTAEQRWKNGRDPTWWLQMSASTKNGPTYSDKNAQPMPLDMTVAADRGRRLSIMKSVQHNGFWMYKDVRLNPPVVDCTAGFAVLDTPVPGTGQVEIRNRATKTPKFSHFYLLGQEGEFKNTLLFKNISAVTLANSGSLSGTALSATGLKLGSSVTELDSGPRHWTITKYNEGGDFQAPGAGTLRFASVYLGDRSTVVHEDHQSLFVASDQRVPGGALTQKTTTGGIELYLSASGGGYHLCSAISRQGSDQITRSHPNLIIPNKWHYLYASYDGLTATSVPSVQIYLDGSLVQMDGTYNSSVLQAGGGNFDTLISNGAVDTPMIGGHVESSLASSRRDFSGFIQDIAFWSNRDTSRATNYLDTIKGIKAGSSYIDTADSKLATVLKVGIPEGQSPPFSFITRLGGYLSDPSGRTKFGFDSSTAGMARSFITGPPKGIFRNKHGVSLHDGTISGLVDADHQGELVISFWASCASGTDYHKIISFNSDEMFPKDEYVEHFSDGSADAAANKRNHYQRTHDSSTTPNDSTFTRLSISLRRNSDDNYRIRFYRAMPTTNSAIDTANAATSIGTSRGDVLNEFTQWSDFSDFTGPAGTFFHNTIVVTGDGFQWWINGTLQTSESWAADYGDDDNTFHESGDRYENRYGYIGKGNGRRLRHFRGGWNNITIFNEDQTFTAGSKIDEVAVLSYRDLNFTQRDDYAQAFYNNGAIYNFALNQANLYGWWRMGEQAGAPHSSGHTLNLNDEVLDEGGLDNHLTSLNGGSLTAFTRTGGGLSDLLNWYKFNSTSTHDPNVPALDGFSGTDEIGARTLSRVDGSPSGFQTFADYSFDSYRVAPLGWLACEAAVNNTIIGGVATETMTDASSEAHWNKTAQNRLRSNSVVYNPSTPTSLYSDVLLGDFAIFAGASNILDPNDTTTPIGNRLIDQTRSRTSIKFSKKPVANEKLVIILNPKEVAGGATTKQLIINFTDVNAAPDGADADTDPDAVSTSFSTVTVGAGTPTVTEYHAHINTSDTASDTLVKTLTNIKNLLDDTSGMNVDGTSTGWTKTSDGANTINIVSNTAGGDGKYEVIAKFIAAATEPTACHIVSVVGASHISKALCRRPSFGYTRMDGSDFSKTDSALTLTQVKNKLDGARGGTGAGGGGGLKRVTDNGLEVVKPYFYAVQSYSTLGGQAGSYSVNAGLGGTVYFNLLNVGPGGYHSTNNSNPSGYTFGLASGNPALDSGSYYTTSLDNTPSLDFNKITSHANHYCTPTGSIFSYTSALSPKALIGGSTGARARFGPGVLQNNYNQFAQEINKGGSVTIDSQFSASACYFRRHTLTASTSFVTPNGGFLQKLSASHNAESSSTFLIGNMSASHLFLGSAKWEAGDFAGRYNEQGTFQFKPKKPFFDDYGAFIEQARPLMKDYGIVPEFRISDHVNSYLTRGSTEQKLDFLNITGGLEAADTSNKPDFFKIYSTSDFLKHFEMVQEDHSDFVDPFAIRLRCSVVKKFLPYEGFYPAQRTVQVAEQFMKSYGDNVNISEGEDGLYDLSKESDYGVQYLLNPLFSPGILYNTIKSGVAVDYPLVTDTGSVKQLRYKAGDLLVPGGAMITEQFDTRIPFEALVEPEKHLANTLLASNEPDEAGNTQIEVEWGGQGDQLYNLMISNFLAETSEFFLENKSFTSLASLSQGDPNFGNAKAGNIYMMRLKMFRSTTGKKPLQRNRLSKSYGVPQDEGPMSETFTMYSRPSAFGPPQYLSGSGFTATTWADFKFDGTSGSLYIDTDQNPFRNLKAVPFQHDFSYSTGSVYGSVHAHSSAIGNEAAKGYNYPFTPPYYHGEAWADITFIPTESKKYTLQEIINQSSVEFYRYFAGAGTLNADGFTPTTVITPDDRLNGGSGQSTLSFVHDRTVVINDQAMQLASSVNIFSQGVLEQDITTQAASGIRNTTNVQVDTDIANKYRWIIQTKFETPILNFNRYTYGKHTNETGRDRIAAKRAPSSLSVPDSNVQAVGSGTGDTSAPGYSGLPLYTNNAYGIELPGVGPMQTPIGMWHQYGHMPQNTKEGVFLQVDDVPRSWIRNAMYRPPAIAKRHRSLANLCGFSTDPVRMGEIAGVKEISEAVVAIPFFEKAGRRRFFAMDRRQIKLALDPAQKNLVGRTVIDMVEKMQKFVMPPSLDFVANDKIKPFSMYIFEFNHNLTKQDLADIWQNLPPELHETVQTDEVSISHQLLAYELLGKGGRYRRGKDSEVELVRNDRADSINPEIQWMVFKVKQKAKTNYFEKIFARNESQQILSQRLKLGVSADALGRKKRISYNWPYDFFSMIEGVKLNAEVHFLDFDEEASQAQEKPVIKPKTKDTTKNREKRTAPSRRLLGAVSGKVPPDKLKKTAEEVDKKPKRKKGKITRKRRTKTVIKKPDTRKKKLNNAFDRKKIK